MDDLSKLSGENGCIFIDNSVTNQQIYQLYVASDAVFTVLNEAVVSGGTETDLMTTMNLTGKTIPAGSILTSRNKGFSDISVSSGKLIGYFL